jgi:hypothetical protein
MENIKSYGDFLNEAKIQEKEGISPAIYKDLKDYFEGCKKDASVPNLKGAQEHINKTKKSWELSNEDFIEAKKEFMK